QIYLDCGGHEQSAASQEESLRWALRSMGVAPEYIPEDFGQLVSAYRSALADRQVLVLLDNVANDMPIETVATRTGLELATCRGMPRLSTDTAALCLGPLSDEHAMALLRREAGPAMYWHEDDADQLARFCGRLPRSLVAVADQLRNTTESAGWFADALDQ